MHIGRKKKSVFDELGPVDEVAGAMIALGALNWGLVGAANFDLVRAAFGRSVVAKATYGLIGASAAYALVRGRQLARS
jgi:uncharacterized membrane protein YuzA (DUF378 family)